MIAVESIATVRRIDCFDPNPTMAGLRRFPDLSIRATFRSMQRLQVRLLVPIVPLLLTGCPASTPKPVDVNKDNKAATGGQTDAPDLRHPNEVHFANIKQLTDGGENAEAYWSFDSKQLIFQTKREPFKCDQIMTMPADGSAEPTLVSTGKGRTTCSYFMPGNQEIVYSSTHDRNVECPPEPSRSQGYVWPLYSTYDVWKSNTDGTNLHKLTDRVGYDAEATVCSTDGSIIFTSDRDGDLDLYRMDADGKNVKRLTDAPGYDGGAFFSQDCTKIVWRASRPQGDALKDYQALLAKGLVRPSKLELFVADADGKNPRQITYLDTAAFAPYFHPSGKRILFSTNKGDPTGREFNIWAVDIDGSNMEQITFTPGFDGFPMFSWDGKKIAFASNRNNKKRGETNVFVADWVESPPKTSRPEKADVFRDRVAWLADDKREGRGVGTQGLADSADWLAREFAAIGAVGAADASGSFKQPLDVATTLERGSDTKLVIDGKTLAAADFVPASTSGIGAIKGRTVFVNYGIVSKEHGIDDYKRTSVKGKVVVVRRFTPTGKPFDDNKLRRRYGDIQYKAFQAQKRGATGLIIVDVPPKGAKQVPDAELPKLYPKGRAGSIPIAFVTRSAGAGLVKGKHKIDLNVALKVKNAPVHNVVAKIPAGANNRVAGAVVVGAHYDHLGWGDDGSLENGKRVVHNGADDNASGTAALLQVAEQLVANRSNLRRDVYLIAFTAEESGLLGSAHFVNHLPPGLDSKTITAMLNMDMVGRMRGNKVTVMGETSAPEWTDLVQPACRDARVTCDLGGDGYGPSDQMSFYMAGIPVLHFFTGAHLDYHKSSDDTHLINAVGGAKIADIVAQVTATTANRETKLTYKKTSMPAPKGDVRATGGSLGTIPAYGDSSNQPGMLIGDVRKGGPADVAGMRGGDRVVRIDDTEIRSVRDLMFVLREAVPGQKADITVIRDGKKVVLKAVFGKSRRRH